MIILHDPDTLLHETVELLGAKIRPALESPSRIQAIVTETQASNHDFRIISAPDTGKLDRLLRLIQLSHKSDYLEHIQSAHAEWLSAGFIEQEDSVLPECFAFTHAAKKLPQRPKDIYARAGYYAFDMSCGIMDKTFQSAIASANLALSATDVVMHDQEKPTTVLALCRPPGHHCDGLKAGGYCYINNLALAVDAYRETASKARIGVLDIDFHHGNGTQEIFYNDPQVFYTSIHGEDEFPYYTGAADEQGGNDAAGTNLNLPLKPGSSFDEYMQKLEIAIVGLADFKADFLLISLGFDTFYLDPLGSFQIETPDYAVMARRIRQQLADMPAVIIFEGGYVIEHLGANTLSFLRGWEDVTP